MSVSIKTKTPLFFGHCDGKNAYFTPEPSKAIQVPTLELAEEIANLCTIVSNEKNKVVRHSLTSKFLVAHERDTTEVNTLIKSATPLQNSPQKLSEGI